MCPTPSPFCPQPAHPTLIMLSLEPVQKRTQGSALWAGSHASDVIHFLCPWHCPRGSPVAGSHSQMSPFMSPLAMNWPSGDHATTRTQFLWPCGGGRGGRGGRMGGS